MKSIDKFHRKVHHVEYEISRNQTINPATDSSPKNFVKLVKFIHCAASSFESFAGFDPKFAGYVLRFILLLRKVLSKNPAIFCWAILLPLVWIYVFMYIFENSEKFCQNVEAVPIFCRQDSKCCPSAAQSMKNSLNRRWWPFHNTVKEFAVFDLNIK